MEFLALNKIISIIKDDQILPEAKFWDYSAKKYLIRQRYQDYSVHFDRIFKEENTIFNSSKSDEKSNNEFLFLNLASGKIVGKGKLIQYLLSNNDLNNKIFLVNIDISKKMIEHNNNKLLEMGFSETIIDSNSENCKKWLEKDYVHVLNVYGDVENLFVCKEPIQDYKIPKNYKILCFDGLSNLNLSSENKIDNIFKFLSNFSYSYTTWLYPGEKFTFFKEKLDFYLKIIKNKQNLPLNFLKIRYFTIEENSIKKSRIEWQDFSKERIGTIFRDVEKYISKKELVAAQVTFIDKLEDPSIKFHVFYGQINFLSNYAKNNNLKLIYEPKYTIRKKEKSFIKTYPLIFRKKSII